MEKQIKLIFNSSGVLIDTESDQIRQGDDGVKLIASFQGKNNQFYVARYTLTRPDDKVVKGLMNPATTTTDFEKVLDSAYYFAVDGSVSLTVFLFSGSQVLAQGQATISVEKTDFSEETTITPDEYDELVNLLASKLNITGGIMKFATMTELEELSNYEAGQVMFFINGGSNYSNHSVLLKINASQTGFDLLFDFTNVENKVIDDNWLNESSSSEYLHYQLGLIGKDGNPITAFDIHLNKATTTTAGLMSALDKEKLDDVPTIYETKQHATETYETKAEAQSEYQDLQEQIDAIVSKSDVVDVVGTHAELLEYDTSKLGDKDIIKVLVDETKQNQRSYYRWLKDDEEFDYIGSEGEFYTKAESDTIFLKKVDAEATYQHKVKVFDHKPSTSELANGEVGVVPSIEPDDYIIGDGLVISGEGKLQTNKLVATPSQTTEIVGKGVSVPNLSYNVLWLLVDAFKRKIPAYIDCSPLNTTFQVVSGHLINTNFPSLNIVLEQNGITYLVNYKVNSGTNVVITASDMPTAPFVLNNVELGDIEGTYEGELTKAECDRLFLHDNMIIDFPDQVSNGIHYYLKKVVEEVNANNVIYSSDDWIFKLNSVNYKFTIEPVKHTKLYKHTILLGGTDQTKLVLILANHKTQFSGSASILADEKYISSAVEFYKIDGSTTSTITIFQKKLVIGAKNSPASLFVLHATAQGASTESIALSGVSIVSDTVEEL